MTSQEPYRSAGRVLGGGQRLYEGLTNSQPEAFDWKFTKADLFDLLQRLAAKEAEAIRRAPQGNGP